MAAEVLLALIRANIAASAAIVGVVLLRCPARRLFGVQLAYALWLAVPAAMLGALFSTSDPSTPYGSMKAMWLANPPHPVALLAFWLTGVAASLGLVAWAQLRFLAAARAGTAGPAVTGIVHARLVVPSDFAERFTPAERKLVRAHERAHIDRLDVRVNAWTVLIQCLGWFNPLIHLAARAMRLDQELACDAMVVGRLPHERRAYAEALLKAGLAQIDLPLGCCWTARGVHPLEARITMLTRPAPTGVRQDVGIAVLAAVTMTAMCTAWAAQPPQPPWLALIVTLPFTVMFDLA